MPRAVGRLGLGLQQRGAAARASGGWIGPAEDGARREFVCGDACWEHSRGTLDAGHDLASGAGGLLSRAGRDRRERGEMQAPSEQEGRRKRPLEKQLLMLTECDYWKRRGLC